MDVEKLFHMTGGAAPNSYAKNSYLQGRLGPDHVDRGNYILWELLTQSLANLFSLGKIEKKGSAVAMAVRAIQESMLRYHFGGEDEVLDTLFEIYGRLMDGEMAKKDIRAFSFLIVLKKL
ncbi:hypothetical protein ACOSP7_009534 [Xanthoceras sorbifolium]